MKRPILITVSGMVGSGKSTAVASIVDYLRRQGLEATSWRFQQLPCISLRLRSSPRPPSLKTEAGAKPRGSGYRRKSLTAVLTLGYLLRIAAFRVFRRWPPVPEFAVADRYFYDSFVHYESGGAARFYTFVISRLVPKPNLAFLLVASSETIVARCPQYSADYIESVHQRYRELRRTFPELIEITTDADQPTAQQIERALRERLGR